MCNALHRLASLTVTAAAHVVMYGVFLLGGNRCRICFDVVGTKGRAVTVCSQRHACCESCILRWVQSQETNKQKPTCPTCRRPAQNPVPLLDISFEVNPGANFILSFFTQFSHSTSFRNQKLCLCLLSEFLDETWQIGRNLEGRAQGEEDSIPT